jgi:hypothetical protein
MTPDHYPPGFAVISKLRKMLEWADVIMPGPMNGRQLAGQVAKRRALLKVLFTSGYTENAIVHHGRLDPGVLLLAKPYRRTKLARMIRVGLDAPPVSRGLPRAQSSAARKPPPSLPHAAWPTARHSGAAHRSCRHSRAHAVPRRSGSASAGSRPGLAALPSSGSSSSVVHLRLGAYVGDGAVIDRQFGTTDVLIILPVSAINARYLDHFGPAAERHAA